MNIFHISAINEVNQAMADKDFHAMVDLRNQFITTTVFENEDFRIAMVKLCDTLILSLNS